MQKDEKIQEEDIPGLIQEKALKMQIKYHKLYPNARQHIVATPPMEKTHEQTNEELHNLGQFTKSQYVSHKAFLDNNTKKLRGECMRKKKSFSSRLT